MYFGRSEPSLRKDQRFFSTKKEKKLKKVIKRQSLPGTAPEWVNSFTSNSLPTI